MAFVFGLSLASFARAEEVQVGRKAAQKYFSSDSERPTSRGSGDNLLMLHLGQYTDSQSYNWGPSNLIYGAGQANYGVTYLMDQWRGLDVNLRADFSEYSLQGTRAVKLAIMPLVTFPRAETKFPLYFGIGGGGGVFLQQYPNSSNISFDYELVLGLRFMELVGSLGLFAEYGMKNHLLLLSQGQFNGTVISGGLIFNF